MTTQPIVAINESQHQNYLSLSSCGECRSYKFCPMKSVHFDGCTKVIVAKHRILHKHNELYRQGEKVKSLYMVRSGAVKTQRIFQDGAEQIMGFYLPGDMLGFDGLAKCNYRTSAIALGTVAVCEFSYDVLDTLIGKQQDLARHCMQLMSEEIVREQQMISSLALRTAEERLADFLVDLSGRYAERGLLATPILVPMLRRDIGNYLGVKPETVSRMLKRFQNAGWIKVNRSQIDILDMSMLKFNQATSPICGIKLIFQQES